MRLPQFVAPRAVLAVSTATFALAPAAASAQLLDTGVGNGTTYRTTAGVGQAVAVSTTTQLTTFGFYLGANAGTTVKYVIFNGSDNTLLYSQTRTFTAAVAQGTLELTAPFTFTLVGGQTYYFGVLGNGGAFNVSYFGANAATAAHGLAVSGTNVNYDTFAAPVYTVSGGATIALRLNGTQGPVTTTPEPGTWALLGTGLATLAGVARRRRTTTA